VIDRIAAKDLDAFALHDFRNGGAEFHADLSPILADVGLGLRSTVGTGINRSVKRAYRFFREVLVSRFAFRRAASTLASSSPFRQKPERQSSRCYRRKYVILQSFRLTDY
jgi:hypothetical protein